MQNWGFISNKLEPRSFFSYSYRLCLLLFCCFTCLFKFKSLTYTDGPTDLNEGGVHKLPQSATGRWSCDVGRWSVISCCN